MALPGKSALRRPPWASITVKYSRGIWGIQIATWCGCGRWGLSNYERPPERNPYSRNGTAHRYTLGDEDAGGHGRSGHPPGVLSASGELPDRLSVPERCDG